MASRTDRTPERKPPSSPDGVLPAGAPLQPEELLLLLLRLLLTAVLGTDVDGPSPMALPPFLSGFGGSRLMPSPRRFPWCVWSGGGW